ncbi:MAG: hypothetical protein DCF28_09265 [Alphaproteobacteria bacterium]|nr:MAG: hypothetical protein DCF28_09265 [Alphaproteobacteria bacterium]PZO37105.1 MAG: hypothetical protein DCE92_08110 [Alphaproteobacteria bacterium]
MTDLFGIGAANLPIIDDPAVAALRAARQRPAVAKLELAKQRSASPDLPILAFEGDDDKITYFQWISRIRPGMKYVSFPCSGKGQLLALRSSLQSDVTGLADAVYFFVDRDFDELREHAHGDDVFMTEMYSVENYIVCENVLDSVLQIEFHCHADKNVRNRVLEIFRSAYDAFLNATADINRQLYVARRLGIEIDPLPNKIGKIVQITLTMDDAVAVETRQVIRPRSELPENGVADLIAEFDDLEPRSRYRGKFAYFFFKRWLEELVLQNDEAERGVFSGLANRSAFRVSELTLNSLSSKADLPDGLVEFVASIDPPAH